MVAASYNLGRLWGVCLDLAGSWATVSQTPSKHAQNLEKGMFSQECNRGGFGECPGLRILPLLHPCWVRDVPEVLAFPVQWPCGAKPSRCQDVGESWGGCRYLPEVACPQLPVLNPWPPPCPRCPTQGALSRGKGQAGFTLPLTGPPLQNPN